VPVDPRNFRNYKRGDVLVSLAGIMANLLLALSLTLLIVGLIHLERLVPAAAAMIDVLFDMARYGLVINLVLAFFNLIPIPPLDGSHVMYHLLPPRMGMVYRELGRYGMLILLVVLIFARPVISVFMWPVDFLLNAAQAFINLWT